MEDSLDAFTEAAGGAVELPRAERHRGSGRRPPRQGLRPDGRVGRPTAGDVVIRDDIGGGLDLGSPLLVATAALEITVHGWDVGQATGRRAPLPDQLAGALLPVAHRVVDPGDRGVRFGAAPAGGPSGGVPACGCWPTSAGLNRRRTPNRSRT